MVVRYQRSGFWLWFRFITALIGVLLGLSAGVAFSIVFKNYHASGWAFVSGLLACITLTLHLSVWKDVTFSIRPDVFTKLIYLGVFGSLLGFGVFVGYLTKGVLVHEKGVQVHGWFIVTVWGWMTWKWGFLLFWFSKNYLRGLNQEIGSIMNLNSSEYLTS